MPRPLDYLSTVSALQQVLQNLEVSLDKTRAEEENEWKVRYDVHMRFKLCLEMRMHRALQRIQYLREALRDGGLEYHRNYWMSPGYVVTRSVYALEKLRRQKLLEVADKEARLERDAKILKEERNRRRLLQEEVNNLKLGSNQLPWISEVNLLETREILKEKIDDVVNEVLNKTSQERDELLERETAQRSRPRNGLAEM